jgi:hypothetical protein
VLHSALCLRMFSFINARKKNFVVISSDVEITHTGCRRAGKSAHSAHRRELKQIVNFQAHHHHQYNIAASRKTICETQVVNRLVLFLVFEKHFANYNPCLIVKRGAVRRR